MKKKFLAEMLDELADTGLFTQETLNDVKKRMLYYATCVLNYSEIQEECEEQFSIEELDNFYGSEEEYNEWNYTGSPKSGDDDEDDDAQKRYRKNWGYGHEWEQE